MAGLQRSGETFRRSGSSGLVWEDRFLPGEMDHHSNKAAAEAARKKEEGQQQQQQQEEEQEQPGAELRHSHSTRGGYRSRVSPAIDPPSPKASGCCFGIFGKPQPPAVSASKPKPKPKPQHRPAATRR